MARESPWQTSGRPWRAVEEPELRRSIVELGMVQGVAVDGETAVGGRRAAAPGRRHPGRAARAGSSSAVGAVAGRRPGRGRPPRHGRRRARGRRPRPEGRRRRIRSRSSTPPRPAAAPGRASNPFTDTRTRVLAIASGKGGVGKSSVTTNLSIALAQRGHRVAAVDADVWGFSMPRMLGIQHPPGLIDDVIVPPEAHGVRLISMGFFAARTRPSSGAARCCTRRSSSSSPTSTGASPTTSSIDMPPGTGDVSLSMAQFLPRAEVIVVTTPQPAAQRVAQRAAAMAEKVDLDVIGVIENMSWFRGDDGKRYELFGAGGGEELADAARRAAARRRSRSCPRCARAATTAPDRRRRPRRRGRAGVPRRSPSGSTPRSRRKRIYNPELRLS